VLVILYNTRNIAKVSVANELVR